MHADHDKTIDMSQIEVSPSGEIHMKNGSTIRVFDDGSDVHLEGAPWAGQWIELPPTDDTSAMLALWDALSGLLEATPEKHGIDIPDETDERKFAHGALSLAFQTWESRARVDADSDPKWPEGFACCRWCGYSVEPDETCDCREEL